MTFDTKHPEYEAVLPDFDILEDTHAGERRVKSKRYVYLPATSGQILDGALTDPNSIGAKAYEAYLIRAIFPNFVKEAVETLVGVMHREEPEIKLPRALEPMRTRASSRGEGLVELLRRVNEQQLLYGRFGLLVDIPGPDAEVPHLVGYKAKKIINWDPRDPMGSEPRFVMLDESARVRDGFAWTDERRYRALLLGQTDILATDQDDTQRPVPPEGVTGDFYWTAVEVEDGSRTVTVPTFRGRTLDQLPFVVIGANDLALEPDEMPLLGLANLCLAIYRGEADYRQTLFMQGQATLVIIGEELKANGEAKDETDPTRVGNGAVIRVPLEGDAKYIGAPTDGISEQRFALESDRMRARESGSRLLEQRGSQAESGEALKVRVAASTATLFQIAKTGAAGLERVLRLCAEWVGADPDEVKITPNLEFAETPEPPANVRDLMDAKGRGLPLSRKSIHMWLSKNRYTAMSFEEEERELKRETPPEPALADPNASNRDSNAAPGAPQLDDRSELASE